jgi:energy-coupling factor transporter ATP-binding protein EcfA2
VGVLRSLKKGGRMTILVVSHDIDELVPLIDETWEMKPGGFLVPMPCPMPTALI